MKPFRIDPTTDTMDPTDLLIADYLEPDPPGTGVTAYRLRGSHLPVHQVVRSALAASRSPREVARELGIYYRAVEAALAYYRRHREAFAWRILAPAVAHRNDALPYRALPPWWVDALQIIGLGIIGTLVCLLLVMWAG